MRPYLLRTCVKVHIPYNKQDVFEVGDAEAPAQGQLEAGQVVAAGNLHGSNVPLRGDIHKQVRSKKLTQLMYTWLYERTEIIGLLDSLA